MEWHEAFTVLLGPEGPEGAMFGPITMATFTILDNEVSGSLVLPASPVVSLRVLCGEPQTVLWFATVLCGELHDVKGSSSCPVVCDQLLCFVVSHLVF